MNLLEADQAAIEAIEIYLSNDRGLTLSGRGGLLSLQASYERLVDQLQGEIDRHR
jgi:hypothetical protein